MAVVAGKRKREEAEASTSKKVQVAATKIAQVTTPKWPELLRGIQGDKGEPGAIVALHQLVRVFRTQGASAATSKKSSNDEPFKTWSAFLDHWEADPSLKDIIAAWEKGDQAGNTNLTVAALQAYTTLLNISCLPSSGIIAVGSAHQKTVANLIIELLGQLKHIHKYLVQQGKNELTTAALELVNALLKIVRFAPSRSASSRKIWTSLNLDARAIIRLLGTKRKIPMVTKAGRKPDIRHLMLSTLLSLLAPSASLSMKAEILGQKGLISAIFKGLAEDPVEAVELVLEIMAHLTNLDRLGMDLRSRIAEDSWSEAIKLLERDTLSPEQAAIETPVYTPAYSSQRYLHFVITALAKLPSGAASLSSHQRRALGNLIGLLSISESELQADVALHALASAPELLPGFWAKFAPSLEPRLSSRWITAIGFASRLAGTPLPPTLVEPVQLAESGTFPPASSFSVTPLLDSALMPAHLGKVWISKALQQSQANPLVAYLTCNFLFIGLRKCAAIIEALEALAANAANDKAESYRSLSRRLKTEARERVPDLQVLIALVQTGLGRVFSRAGSVVSTVASETGMEVDVAAPAPEDDNTLLISLALRTIALYHPIAPAKFSSLRFDFGKLLNSSFFATSAQETESAPLAAIGQAALLSLLSAKPDDQGEGAINWQWHKASEGSRSPIASIINIYLTSPFSSLRSQAEQTATSLLGSSLLFEHDQTGVQIWLKAIPRSSPTAQAHALAFLDACIQRCLQTPYKYIDATSQICSKESTTICTSDKCGRSSPLIGTFVEQLPHRLADQAMAASLADYVDRLVVAFCGYRDCLCLAEQFVAAVKRATSEARSAGSRDLFSAAEQSLLAVKSTSRIGIGATMVGIQSDDTADTSDPLQHIILFVHYKTTTGIEDCKKLQHNHAMNTLVLSDPLPLVRLAKYTLDSQEASSTLSFLAGLIPSLPAADRQRAVPLLLVSKEAIAMFASELAKGSCTNALGLLTVVNNSRTRLPFSIWESYLAAVLSSPIAVAETVYDLMLPELSQEQRLRVLAHLISSKTGKPAILSRIAESMASDMSPDTASFVQEHWEDLLQLRSESVYELVADVAETCLPAGILENTPSSVFHPTSLNWISEAAKHITANKLSSFHTSRLVAAALYRNHREAFLAKQGDFEHNAPALLANLQVQHALGKANSISAPTVTAAIDAFLTAAGGLLRDYAGRILVELCSPFSTTAAGVISNLSNAIPAAGASNPSIFGKYSISILDRTCEASSLKAESFSLMEAFVNESLRWLVRRFAEDEANTEQVESFLQALSDQLDKYRGKWLLKAHLVDPVITAGIQNRLADQNTVKFLGNLLRESKLQSASLTKYLQTILSDSSLRSALDPSSPLRLGIVSLIEAAHTHAPHLLGQLRALPTLLSYYTGTMSSSDQAMLRIFRLSELAGQTSFRQLVKQWIPPHLRGVAVSQSQVIAGLEPEQMHKACVLLLQRTSSPVAEDSTAYDPLFLLPYISMILDGDEISRTTWMALVSSGSLSLAVCALASPQRQFQLAGDRTLAKVRNALQASPDFREKEELSYLLDSVRNSVDPSSALDESLPPLIAHFMAQSLSALANPGDFVYPLMWRYLLSRPILEAADVPLFYNLFYSSADNAREERLWLFKSLVDGVHTNEDWRILRRRQVIDLCLSYLQSGSAVDDAETRLWLFKVLSQVTQLPAAAQDLVGHSSLFGILAQVSFWSHNEEREVLKTLDNCVSCVRPTKLRRARDGLWIVDALAVLERIETSNMDLEDLARMTHTLRRLVIHLARSTKSPNLEMVIRLLRQAYERVITRLDNFTSDISSMKVAIRDLYDGAVRLEWISGSALLPEQITSLALRVGLPGIKEEVIRAWHR